MTPEISLPLNMLAMLLFIVSFLLSYYIVDKIRGVMLYKKIVENPNERSSHRLAVPNLGGMAFFIVLMLSFFFFQEYDDGNLLLSFLPGLCILFVVGLKDDLVVLAPLSKLLAQIVATCFLVFQHHFSISSLHGFMGINDLPVFFAVTLAIILVVSIINSINLIDGIDGLAATVSIIIFTAYGGLFYFAEKTYFTLIAIVMIGILLAFLRFNLSKDKKIFMGDTGAMILGFINGAMTLRFLSLDDAAIAKLPFYFENIPLVVGAILIVPFFDTVRVFILRLMERRSPFSPDRSHIHHIIIDRYKISHRKASFSIGLIQVILILLLAYLATIITQWYLLLFFSLIIIVAVIYFYKNQLRR